jgi:hypothetical protein
MWKKSKGFCLLNPGFVVLKDRTLVIKNQPFRAWARPSGGLKSRVLSKGENV